MDQILRFHWKFPNHACGRNQDLQVSNTPNEYLHFVGQRIKCRLQHIERIYFLSIRTTYVFRTQDQVTAQCTLMYFSRISSDKKSRFAFLFPLLMCIVVLQLTTLMQVSTAYAQRFYVKLHLAAWLITYSTLQIGKKSVGIYNRNL